MKQSTRYPKFLIYCILGFLVIESFSSCCKSCSDWLQVYVGYNEYKKHEVDSVIFLKYNPNTNFTVLIDSTYSMLPQWSHDSSAQNGYINLTPDADYIIKFPSANFNKVFTFSNFEIIEKKCGCDDELINVVNSFTVNGNTVYGYSYDLPR